MAIELNHIGLLNVNETDAKKFYQDILGLKQQYRFSLSAEEGAAIFGIETNFKVLVFADERFKFEIFLPQESLPLKTAITHVCLNVPDRAAIVERCRENGLKVVEFKRGERLTVFVWDFAGNIFELKERAQKT